MGQGRRGPGGQVVGGDPTGLSSSNILAIAVVEPSCICVVETLSIEFVPAPEEMFRNVASTPELLLLTCIKSLYVAAGVCPVKSAIMLNPPN